MQNGIKIYLIFISALSAFSVGAAETVRMNFVEGKEAGKPAGTIQITETSYGLLLTPDLKGMHPGIHGFHIHEKPDCSKAGMAAGGHLDPAHTDKHLGPYQNGHLGDLPALYATADGRISLPVLAPRLMHVPQIKGHALMIHEGGDNYADAPLPLGGGQGRMVCGVVQ